MFETLNVDLRNFESDLAKLSVDPNRERREGLKHVRNFRFGGVLRLRPVVPPLATVPENMISPEKKECGGAVLGLERERILC